MAPEFQRIAITAETLMNDVGVVIDSLVQNMYHIITHIREIRP